jgi:hypothetical protein
VAEGKSVLAQVYPSRYRRRFPRADRSADEWDAWSVAAWLRDADRRGSLERYVVPPLTASERQLALLEGWILGVVWPVILSVAGHSGWMPRRDKGMESHADLLRDDRVHIIRKKLRIN